MTSLALLLALAQPPGGGVDFVMEELGPDLAIRWTEDPLETAKIAPSHYSGPKNVNEYDWLTTGFGAYGDEKSDLNLRFRVYSQERKAENDTARFATRMLLRMWRIAWQDLGLDHNLAYNAGAIDVYLGFGGKAGGEYALMVDTQGKRPRQVPVIFVYDLASFTSPVEMAREIAHEYGHAILPPVGGYTAPENWANGVLGERLFIDRLLRAGFAGPDAMHASPDALKTWAKSNIEPSVRRGATLGPFAPAMVRRDASGFGAYVDLMMWTSRFLPGKAFGRSMKFVGTMKASVVPAAIVQAAAELETFKAPALGGAPIWLPLPAGKKVGGGKILLRRDGWIKVQPTAAEVTIS